MDDMERQIITLVADNKAAVERVQMARDLLIEVVERTQNYREGWFSLRLLIEHEGALFRLAFCSEEHPVIALEALNREYDNLRATIMREVERLDN